MREKLQRERELGHHVLLLYSFRLKQEIVIHMRRSFYIFHSCGFFSVIFNIE